MASPCASFLPCMSSGNRVIRDKLSIYVLARQWRPLSPGRGFPGTWEARMPNCHRDDRRILKTPTLLRGSLRSQARLPRRLRNILSRNSPNFSYFLNAVGNRFFWSRFLVDDQHCFRTQDRASLGETHHSSSRDRSHESLHDHYDDYNQNAWIQIVPAYASISDVDNINGKEKWLKLLQGSHE